MCIKQQFHAVPVQNSSGNGASKSALILMLPACNPATRRVVALARGTRRARGVCPSVRMISVPAATCATSSRRCCCASWTSTVLVVIVCLLPLGQIVAHDRGDVKADAQEAAYSKEQNH